MFHLLLKTIQREKSGPPSKPASARSGAAAGAVARRLETGRIHPGRW